MKMDISTIQADANAVGTAVKDEKVTSFVDMLKQKWIDVKTGMGSATKITMVQTTKFLLASLNMLIDFVEELMKSGEKQGPNKKATVLSAFATLYDYTVKDSMPIWMKPLKGSIKGFVIYTVVSLVVDWVVSQRK